MEQLMQLKELYAQGVLSAEEYNARKTALVDSLTGTSAGGGAGGYGAAPQQTPGGYGQTSAYGAAAQ
eukprot:CAMPEP_0119130184 /NCGR_PEP_ID=MMETSP1310-20130426/7623_1 /TAXON_ID=464262 /ORGANISM="Genus nov. species nov., Strain RCC2339" /LENGTH=66 /DNA_ID=CAMNT_0007120667 /DNA_START=192 /DNA_END=389 /DNA_ORIENTATION=+